ncbi:MAG: hypothetical protein KDE53_40425, partial [Caldilineaceae bacterium]|nr:hypothetical protein [Caldilineaceae bacterium]
MGIDGFVFDQRDGGINKFTQRRKDREALVTFAPLRALREVPILLTNPKSLVLPQSLANNWKWLPVEDVSVVLLLSLVRCDGSSRTGVSEGERRSGYFGMLAHIGMRL